MKKALAILLAAIMVMGLLAGCSGNEKAPESTAPESQAPTSSAPESSAPEAFKWPTSSIEVVNPAAAGGETDVYGRIFQRYMEAELGVTMPTVNMAGGGGTLATNEVASSANDGSRALVFHNGYLINNLMGLSDLNLDNMCMAAVAVTDATQIFFARADMPFNDLKEMVDYVKGGGAVNVATEVGSFTHFQLLMIQNAGDVTLDIVDAGTTSEKIAAMLAGDVDIMGANWATMKDYVANGDVKPLCLLAEERHPACPDVPTAKELGFDIQVVKFFFYAFPEGTDPELVEEFNAAAQRVAQNPDYIAEIEALNASAPVLDVQGTYDYMKDIMDTYSALLD
ncbi:MAG: tripartite tricarboxylate transporter substrate binding protein [Candidatus Heteroscillospira sp.]|jgi:tripartite-type tricarboxylate transporter receptor subunit TctC